MSPDNRNMNLKETCPDDVKNMLITWSREMWNEWAERHEYSELREGLWPEATTMVLARKASEKYGRRSTDTGPSYVLSMVLGRIKGRC